MLNHSKPLRQRHDLSTAGFRMMDVDDPARHPGAERLGKHLHVASQDHQFHIISPDEIEQGGFRLSLAIRAHLQAEERYAIAFYQRPESVVVRSDTDDIHRQGPNAVTIKQVIEALVHKYAPGQKPRHGSERNYLWR